MTSFLIRSESGRLIGLAAPWAVSIGRVADPQYAGEVCVGIAASGDFYGLSGPVATDKISDLINALSDALAEWLLRDPSTASPSRPSAPWVVRYATPYDELFDFGLFLAEYHGVARPAEVGPSEPVETAPRSHCDRCGDEDGFARWGSWVNYDDGSDIRWVPCEECTVPVRLVDPPAEIRNAGSRRLFDVVHAESGEQLGYLNLELYFGKERLVLFIIDGQQIAESASTNEKARRHLLGMSGYRIV